MFSEGLRGSEMSVRGGTPVWPVVAQQRSEVNLPSLDGLRGTEVEQTAGGSMKA